MNIDFEKSLVAFTDGSSLGNPGPGGWGAALVAKRLDEVVELGGSSPKTTNNEMELSAIVGVLSYAVNNTDPLHIFTDSQYAINGITNWIHEWNHKLLLALIALHIGANLYYLLVKKKNLIRPMVTGRSEVARGAADPDANPGLSAADQSTNPTLARNSRCSAPMIGVQPTLS